MALTPLNSGSTATDESREGSLLVGPDARAFVDLRSSGKSAMGMDMVPVYASKAGPEVEIDPTVVQNMGVRTAK